MAKHKLHFRPTEFRDMGLGTQAINQRMLNADGSFNVKRKGFRGQMAVNLYHELITMSWWRFSFIIIAYFFTVNLLFACLYVFAGADSLTGDIVSLNLSHRFFDAFFFSAQTITTVGYGHIHPKGMAGNSIAAVESLTGLLGFALATGLLYGRFSRPVARIKFSNNAIIAPYMDFNAFMFRVANVRSNQLIETKATVNFSISKETNGKMTREFHNLSLERPGITLFPTNWTIVHPITEDSPLYGLQKDDFDKGTVEFFVLLSAFDDTFSQTVHARRSYRYDEIIWGAKFTNMLGKPDKGYIVLELDKISNVDKVALNEVDTSLAENVLEQAKATN